ncbi:MAG: sugar transferase [Sciscionella sp.]
MDEPSRRRPALQSRPSGLVLPAKSGRPEHTGRRVAFTERASARREPTSTPWERRYRTSVIASDVLATVLTVSGGAAVRTHLGAPSGRAVGMMIVTAAVVLITLPLTRAWHQWVLGEGAEEFRTLGRGLLFAAVVLAVGGFAVGALQVRAWTFFVVPSIAALAFPLRYALRQLLHRARRRGRCLLPVMAAGNQETVRDLIMRTRREPHVGWKVEAACTPNGLGGPEGGDVDGVPVVGTLDDIADHVRHGGYRVVAVTADANWSPRRLQQLAWDLERTSADMVVAPVLMEVAGPRLHVSGVLGMPLLRVSAPVFTGGRRIVKAVVDRVASASLLALLSPLMLVVAVAIKLGDGGTVFYRQHRIGRDGRSFTMWKFRTMAVGAHGMRSDLVDANEGSGPLFKLRTDPRVTRLGALLRRYSLDEMPQLMNVFTGAMSLVGPRPPLPEETETYGPDVRRRLLVKPGLTGLWQVSGRSDLSWAEAIRLDLRYVENWSLALDAVILWKTLRAVIRGNGAY